MTTISKLIDPKYDDINEPKNLQLNQSIFKEEEKGVGDINSNKRSKNSKNPKKIKKGFDNFLAHYFEQFLNTDAEIYEADTKKLDPKNYKLNRNSRLQELRDETLRTLRNYSDKKEFSYAPPIKYR